DTRLDVSLALSDTRTLLSDPLSLQGGCALPRSDLSLPLSELGLAHPHLACSLVDLLLTVLYALTLGVDQLPLARGALPQRLSDLLAVLDPGPLLTAVAALATVRRLQLDVVPLRHVLPQLLLIPRQLRLARLLPTACVTHVTMRPP